MVQKLEVVEDCFKGLVITVNGHVVLAKEKLIKLVKSVNDRKGFFFYLSVTPFRGRKGARTVCNRLPKNVTRDRKSVV